jgi:hypothetical protein
MPKLHKHRDRDSHYVLTQIRGDIITFQLTPQGERRLIAAGITSGQQFARALLLDLYRSGDAYTGGEIGGSVLTFYTHRRGVMQWREKDLNRDRPCADSILTIRLPEKWTRFLVRQPESGTGYQRVDVRLANNREIKKE